MRFALVVAVVAVAAFTGCMGPERKLGRGIANVTEVVRMGEMRRSMEQTALWYGPDASYTYGLIHGMNRSLARIGLGVVETVTFPIPPYDPLFTPTGPVYPDYSVRNTKDWGGMFLPASPSYPENNRPGLLEDSLYSTDRALGFSGGDVAPFIPGSRFHIFDN
jgi:putative exosortase-associated protein (TIGR04073 family)